MIGKHLWHHVGVIPSLCACVVAAPFTNAFPSVIVQRNISRLKPLETL